MSASSDGLPDNLTQEEREEFEHHYTEAMKILKRAQDRDE